MSNITTLQPSTPPGEGATALTMIERYDRRLAAYDGGPMHPVTRRGGLIPRADLQVLIAALAAQVRPATKREVAGAIALVATAWPFAWQRLDGATGDAFAQQLTEDLSVFPADILHDAIRELRRTLKFTPSIAELYQAASGPFHERRRRLRLALDHEAEHERRIEEKRAEAAQRAKWLREQQERIDRIISVHGADAARFSAEDLVDAHEGMTFAGWRVRSEWLLALDVPDLWAARIVPVVAVAGRSLEKRRARLITDASVVVAIKLASSGDIAGAHRMIDGSEVIDDNPDVSWSTTEEALGAVVAEARRHSVEVLEDGS